MDNFVVSARKYRPDNFNTVIGQSAITNTLKNSIKNNHLAHAYLLCGPRGVGKTTCARIFAKTINCQNRTADFEACNTCESCRAFNESGSYNIHELDAASNNSVDGIRSLIEQVRIPPQIGKYSVYIIDEVHMLSNQAFNAFLKTLEEPPAHAIFILATTEKHKIIPTILSRCQVFDFNRIKIADIVQHLEYIAKTENIAYETEALNVIAQKADGGMRDALSVFDQISSFTENNITYEKVIETLNVLDYEYYFRLTDTFITGNIANTLLIYDEILNKGFEGNFFINGLSSHLRDLLVAKDSITIQLLEIGDKIKENYKNTASKLNNNFLYKALDITNECDLSLKTSKNQRLHIEIALIKLCNINNIEFHESQKKNSELENNIIIKPQEAKTTVINPQSTGTITSKPIFEQKNSSTSEASVSIKSAFTEPTILSNTQTETPNYNKKNNKFTLTKAQNYFNEFVKTLEFTKPRIYSILNNLELNFDETNLIFTISTNSSTQKTAIDENKLNILSFLKEKLENDLIKIDIQILKTDDPSESKYFTKQEKYDFLLQKNKNLDLLKTEFNLDFN
jgi:DNA polymerase-3 subunit gamma/tau